ncbi:MAG: hypothetical protein AAGA25_17255 [Planctomycetota bacterium]
MKVEEFTTCLVWDDLKRFSKKLNLFLNFCRGDENFSDVLRVYDTEVQPYVGHAHLFPKESLENLLYEGETLHEVEAFLIGYAKAKGIDIDGNDDLSNGPRDRWHRN